MAYTPTGDEHLYLNRFTENRRAIEAYKARYGGDLEGAYQAVMGEPWPEGRSVKISHGRPELTKDRTVKSVLGKYVAPIGAGALTALTLGGGAPALAGVFGGGGAGAAGGGAAAAGGAGTAGAMSGAGSFGLGLTLPAAAASTTGMIGAPARAGGWLTAALPKLAGDVAGAIVTSRGSTQAAETQRAAADLAGRRQDRTTQDVLRRLDASRQAYPNAPPPSSPYPIGGGSLESIRSLAPGPPGRPQGPPQIQGGPAAYQPFSVGNTPPGGPPAPSGGGQMVLLEGPDGSRKSVPAGTVQRYVSRGARVIQ